MLQIVRAAATAFSVLSHFSNLPLTFENVTITRDATGADHSQWHNFDLNEVIWKANRWCTGNVFVLGGRQEVGVDFVATIRA
jgi:hypothetical protein